MLDLIESETPLSGRDAYAPLELARALAAEMGFDYCAYFLQLPLPVTCPQTAIYRHECDGWLEETVRQPVLGQDPLVRHGSKDMRPFAWDMNAVDSTRMPWSDAVGQGFRHGWAHASRDIRGGIGMLLIGSRDDNDTVASSLVIQMQIAWLAQQCHARLADDFFRKHIPEAHVTLTKREREILSWTADGKTAYEIGCILKLTESTVIFHLGKVVRKFGAVNKTQAAVKAASLGMLF